MKLLLAHVDEVLTGGRLLGPKREEPASMAEPDAQGTDRGREAFGDPDAMGTAAYSILATRQAPGSRSRDEFQLGISTGTDDHDGAGGEPPR